MTNKIILVIIVIFLTIVIGGLIIFYHYRIRKRSIGRKTISKATAISIVIAIALTIAVLASYLFFNPDSNKEQFFLILVYPAIVGLITSLISPLLQIPFNTNFVEEDMLDNLPEKVYPPRNEPGTQLSDDLIDNLLKSSEYNYSGLDMTVSTRCLYRAFSDGKCKLSSLHFFIPKPENQNLNKKNLHNLEDSLLMLKDLILYSDYCHRIELTFTLLDFFPPFHIHQANDKIWFAAVIIKSDGIPYPTTYLYDKGMSKAHSNIHSDSISMYDTIDKMMKELNEQSSSEKYKIIVEARSTFSEREDSFRVIDKNTDVISDLIRRIDESVERKVQFH